MGKILLEKEMTTHSSILAWRISWTEGPDGLQSMGPDATGKPQGGGGVLNNSASLSRSMFLDLCTWVLARKVKLEEGTVSSPDAGESRLGFVTPSCFPPSLPASFLYFFPPFLSSYTLRAYLVQHLVKKSPFFLRKRLPET